jgi:hypothetical protein
MGTHIGSGPATLVPVKTYELLDTMLTAMGSTKTTLWPFFEGGALASSEIVRSYGESVHIFTMTDAGTLGFMPVMHPGGVNSYHFLKTGASMHGAGEEHADFSFDGGTDAAFSVGAWVNRDVAGAEQAILAKYDVAGTLREYKFGVDGSNKIFLELYDESLDDTVTSTGDTSLTLNAWQFVVATYGGEGGSPGKAGMTMPLYLNATAESETIADGGGNVYEDMEDTATPLMLGAADDTAAATIEMDGRIALPFLCGKKLTQANVTTIYNTGRTLLGLA